VAVAVPGEQVRVVGLPLVVAALTTNIKYQFLILVLVFLLLSDRAALVQLRPHRVEPADNHPFH
jgi:hypothetical protein